MLTPDLSIRKRQIGDATSQIVIRGSPTKTPPNNKTNQERADQSTYQNLVTTGELSIDSGKGCPSWLLRQVDPISETRQEPNPGKS